MDGRLVIQSAKEKAQTLLQQGKLEESLRISQELMFSMMAQHVELLMRHDHALKCIRGFFQNHKENMYRSFIEVAELIEPAVAAKFDEVKRHFEILAEDKVAGRELADTCEKAEKKAAKERERVAKKAAKETGKIAADDPLAHSVRGLMSTFDESVMKAETEVAKKVSKGGGKFAAGNLSAQTLPKKRPEGHEAPERTTAEAKAAEMLPVTAAASSSSMQPMANSAELKAMRQADTNNQAAVKVGDQLQIDRAGSSAQQSSKASAELVATAKAHASEKAEADNVNDALLQAAMDGHMDVVAHLVKQGSSLDMNPTSNHGKALESALLAASHFNHLHVVQLLVDAGAGVKVTDNAGRTPLIVASSLGHLGVVQYLVAHGANVQAMDKDGFTPLLAAGSGGHLNVIQHLLTESNADIMVKNNAGQDLLGLASFHGHVNVVTYLLTGFDLKNKASINAALIQASSNGQLDVATKLLMQGSADIQSTDADGMTLVHHASSSGHLDVVEYLLEEAGANVNARDNYGATALHYAAGAGHLHVVQYLIRQSGVNVLIKDRNGDGVNGEARFWAMNSLRLLRRTENKDAQQLARFGRLKQIVELLRSWERFAARAGHPINELVGKLDNM